MARPKFLLQEREGQKPFLYVWTPVLAKKSDMRPVSEAEAKKFLAGEDITLPEFVSEEPEDDDENDLLDKLDSLAIKSVEEPKPLVVTQEDILKKDITHINRLKKSASIEEYILKKYKIPMIAMDEIEGMKEQALEILKTLADTNSLYE